MTKSYAPSPAQRRYLEAVERKAWDDAAKAGFMTRRACRLAGWTKRSEDGWLHITPLGLRALEGTQK